MAHLRRVDIKLDQLAPEVLHTFEGLSQELQALKIVLQDIVRDQDLDIDEMLADARKRIAVAERLRTEKPPAAGQGEAMDSMICTTRVFSQNKK